jgi:asparagine synthase (glutamine-hydrolysing)
MCGLVGFFGPDVSSHYDVDQLLGSMAHRGPDDRGIIMGNDWALGHQRLSIVDVESGHQPMLDPSQTLSSVCNGEIYNYRTLQSRYCTGYPFLSSADSEVLLPLYQVFGKDTAKYLDGMFCFIMNNGKEWMAVRDRIGIKPLYVGKKSQHVMFASEMKTLASCADSIHEFPSGHYYHSEVGLQSYYQLPTQARFISDPNEVLPLIRNSLQKSVQKRMMSDVPVGVFLSGGLDSSLIAALMKQTTSQLHSFSVGLPHSPDLKAARVVAAHLDTIHHEYIYTEAEMIDLLPEVIYQLESYDPALVRSAIPCYIVSRLASKYVKVVLTGEGADELFAGYSYLAGFQDSHALHEETLAILNGLHNLNLQRVDRMTMAHGLEGRVPFLDTEFIELCIAIDPNLKLYSTFGIEKWLLRKAFEDLLPQQIVWRTKMEFAQGCASSEVLAQRGEQAIPMQALLEAQAKGLPVSTREELFYFRIFERHFSHPDAAHLIGRWQGTLH